MSAPAPTALARARALAGPALATAVGRLDPDLARVASYHLGLATAAGRPGPAGGGKAIRPALALLSAEAAGAAAASGVPGAVAVELVHNFSLLHDDLMDGDRQRRHRPTAWTVFGPSLAILAGDALLSLATGVLLAVPAGEAAARRLADATDRLIAGQAADLAFERRLDVTVQECLAMAGDKTGALLACAACIGAELAGAGPALLDALAGFGAHLGLAFQAVDDLLGIWGDPQVTGKPAGSDLRQGKKTLPVAFALAAGGPAARRLAGLLAGGRPRDDEEVALAAKLVEEAGGRDRTAAEAARQLDLALARLPAATMPAVARAGLAELARYVVDRER